MANTLKSLGLSQLEGEIYIHLLRESPCTAYRIAQSLGKPPATVYRVVRPLIEKGAVTVDDGDQRLLSPVAIHEFLENLQQGFHRDCEAAESILSLLPGPGEDTRVYQMHTRVQVMERCRRMLRAATASATLDADHRIVGEIAPDLAAAAARGVRVLAIVYEPTSIPGVETVLNEDRLETADRWPEHAQFLNLVTDGTEVLLSLLIAGCEEVVQCLWSQSPFLAWIVHYGMIGDFGLLATHRLLRAQTPAGQVVAAVRELRDSATMHAPGYERLLAQIDTSQPHLPHRSQGED